MKLTENKDQPTSKISLELSVELVESLKAMESFTKISQAVLVETALKRFIASHKDYFPEDHQK